MPLKTSLDLRMPSIGIIDPRLTEALLVFEQSVHRLQSADESEFLALSCRLCELSRTIRFIVGPPDELPREVVEKVMDTFNSGAAAIRERAPDGSQVREFADNISIRATRIREDMENLVLGQLPVP